MPLIHDLPRKMAVHLRHRIAALLQTVPGMARHVLHNHPMRPNSRGQLLHLGDNPGILHTLTHPIIESPTTVRQPQKKGQRAQGISVNNQAATAMIKHVKRREHRRKLTGHNIHGIIMGVKIKAVLAHPGNAHAPTAQILLIVGGAKGTIGEHVIVHELIFGNLCQRISDHLFGQLLGTILKIAHRLGGIRTGKTHMNLTQRMVIVRVKHLLKRPVLHRLLKLLTITKKKLQIVPVSGNRHQMVRIIRRNNIPGIKHNTPQSLRVHHIARVKKRMHTRFNHRLLVDDDALTVFTRNIDKSREGAVTVSLGLTGVFGNCNHSHAPSCIARRV